MGALAGLGAGGAVGGIVGTLGLGIPEYEAKRYEGAVKEGGIHSSPSTVIPQSRSRKLCSEEIYSTSENCAGVSSRAVANTFSPSGRTRIAAARSAQRKCHKKKHYLEKRKPARQQTSKLKEQYRS